MWVRLPRRERQSVSTERKTDAPTTVMFDGGPVEFDNPTPHELRIYNIGRQGGEPVMNDYLKTIIKAQSLIKQLLNDTAYGKFTLGDITISKPEDLHKNFQLGTLITVGVSEWFLTTNSYGPIWQNYSQGVVLDSEGMYILILKALEEDRAVELLHKGV